MTIGQVVSDKTFKDNTILYMYKTQGQGQIAHGDKILIIAQRFHYLNHTLAVGFIYFENIIFQISPTQMYEDSNLTLL